MNDCVMTDSISHDGVVAYDRILAGLSSVTVEEAVLQIKGFLQLYPSFPQAHNDLGVLYHRAGNPTLALAHYEKASRLQPDNTVFRKNLADFYAVELGWYEDATDIYLDILRRNPRDTEALIALGKIGSAMEGRNALPAPEQAAQLLVAPPVAPAPPQDLRNIGDRYRDAQALAGRGDTNGAVNELLALLQIDPACAPAHNDLGVLYLTLNEPEHARRHQQQAVELQPDSVLYRKNLADLLFVALKDYQGALEQYNRLLAKNPRDVEVLNALAQICIDLGLLADAAHFLEQQLAVQPWDREAREALKKLKQLSLATAAPSPAAPARNADELYREAQEQAAAERFDEARDLLEALLRLNPGHAVARNDLGVVSYRLGDVAAAERNYRAACDLEPVNANFRKNLADLCFAELGKTDEAISIYLDLHKKHPRDVEVLLALGQICAAVGHAEEGKSFFRRALEIEPWNRDARSALQAGGAGADKVFF